MSQLIPTPGGWKCDVRINRVRIRQILSRDRAKAKRILRQMVEAGRSKRRGGVAMDMTWEYFQRDFLRKSEVNDPRKTYNHNHRAFELINKVVHVNLLSDMTPDLLIEAQTRLKVKKFKPHAISRGVRAIMTAMRRAEDFKYVHAQNWRLVEYLITKGRMDFFELERLFELVEKLDGTYKTAAFLMGRAGLRTGEALFIEWKDVQFENNRIIFSSRPETGLKIKGDKKLEKVRIVPMYPDLRDYLMSIRKDSGFVLEPPCFRRVDSFGKFFIKAISATGVPTYNKKKAIPYTLRHSFASHLAQAGVSETIIAELMGHEDTSMVKIYSHLRPVDMQKAVSALCPPNISLRLTTPLLTPFNADLAQPVLSSKTSDNA